MLFGSRSTWRLGHMWVLQWPQRHLFLRQEGRNQQTRNKEHNFLNRFDHVETIFLVQSQLQRLLRFNNFLCYSPTGTNGFSFVFRQIFDVNPSIESGSRSALNWIQSKCSSEYGSGVWAIVFCGFCSLIDVADKSDYYFYFDVEKSLVTSVNSISYMVW